MGDHEGSPRWWQVSQGTLVSQHLPTGMLALLLIGYGAATLALIGHAYPERSHIAGALVLILAIAGVQALQQRRILTGHPGPAERATLLAVQAMLTYLPFLAFSETWLAMPGFLAGSGLLLLTGIWRWLAFLSTAVAQLALSAGERTDAGQVLLDITMAAAAGLLIYGVLRLTVALQALQSTHAQLVQVEMSRERVRVDRDLHDLVGNRLSVIGLKTELARRLLDSDPDRARSQLTEIVDIAHGAQADVRALTRGQPTRSLMSEVTAARSALEAAGAHCQVAVCCSDLPGQVAGVLVAVVREGVTNIVGHSTARTCQIEVREDADTVRLIIRNDGAIGFGPSFGRGTGIANLQERAAALGGLVTAELHGDGWFELTAQVARRPGVAEQPVDHDVGGSC